MANFFAVFISFVCVPLSPPHNNIIIIRPRTTRAIYVPPEHENPPRPSSGMKLYMQQALDKKPLINLEKETVSELLSCLIEERRKLAENQKYSEGQKYNEAIKYTRSIYTKMLKQSYQKDIESHAQADYQESTSKLQEFDQETKNLISKLEKQQKEQRDELIRHQKFEAKKFDEKWTSPSKIRMYNHPSYQLTALKNRHEYYLSHCQFDEAKAVQKDIVEKEAQEQVSQYQQMQNDYNNASNLLLKKQREELSLFDKKATLEMENLQRKRASGRTTLEKLEKKKKRRLENSHDIEKVWKQTSIERSSKSTQFSLSFPCKVQKKVNIAKDNMVLKLPTLQLQHSNSPKPTKITA